MVPEKEIMGDGEKDTFVVRHYQQGQINVPAIILSVEPYQNVVEVIA